MIRARVFAVLLVAALVASGCSLLPGGDTYRVTAYFPRAVSLYEQGSVQVLGLPAGEITTVEVIGDRVRVDMAIKSSIRVPVDVQAAIVPQSLIGERRVQLFPPYQEGQPAAEDGHEIPVERTVVPTEPDEALAALDEFLKSLDPDGLGRLIENAATALDGQGENLGAALTELSGLVGNLEANDDDIISIAEKFDDFTQTLLTRESQLAEVLDDFAVVADVLADERDEIEELLAGLADISGAGLDLVSEHAVRLRTDIEIVTRLVRSVDTNLGAVEDLLDSGPKVTVGLLDAYNEELRAIDLRQNFSPLVQEILGPIFDEAGVPLPCIPVDVACEAGGDLPISGLSDSDAVAAALPTPESPLGDILGFLASDPAPRSVDVHDAERSSTLDRVLHTLLGVGG